MTMKRSTKAEQLTRFQERMTGRRIEFSASPRQLNTYGRYLPADYAARFFLSYERETTRHDRETWRDERLARRVRWYDANGRQVCRSR